MATAKKTASQPKSSSVAVTDVSEWKKDTNNDDPLKLPSGKFMKVKNPGFKAFLAAGIIPNALMSIVQKAIDKGKQPDLNGFVSSPERIQQMIELMDNAVIYCAQAPKVHPIPKPDEERDPSILYVDEIEEEDKMFIFQWVTGGTRDLERFRRELTKHLVAIPGSEDVGVSTE